MYVSDEDAVRQGVADLRHKIEQERASTIERVERLRRFVRDEELERREREEWHAFHDRTHYMQREVDVMIRALADLYGLRAPPPFIVTQ